MSKIYFSGINGVGISPLAELAQDMGVEVCGSDMRRGELAPELEKRGIEVFYGKQDGEFLKQKIAEGVLAAKDLIWHEHGDLNQIPGLTDMLTQMLDSIQQKGMLKTVEGVME